MAGELMELETLFEERQVRVGKRPLSFDEFLEMFGEDEDVELIDRVVVQKMAVQDPHENLFGWLSTMMGTYTDHKSLGVVRGSRSAVRINDTRGRLPDLLFVNREREVIVKPKSIEGAPDLVIEIISTNDRPSDLIALETDYRRMGVPEIWFIDQPHKRVRVLNKQNGDYTERELADGILQSQAIKGFWVRVEWLFAEPRPPILDVLKLLFESS